MFGDSLYYPNSSRRMVSMSNQGMVATSQPIAAQVGLEILKTAEMPLMQLSRQPQLLPLLNLHQMVSAEMHSPSFG